MSANPMSRPPASMLPVDVPLGERVTTALKPLVPHRDHLVDAGLTIVLMILVLVGFRTSFFGWTWLLAGVAGLGLGLFAAHLVASYKLPAVVTVLLLAASYFLLGGALAVREDLIAGFIPSGETLSVLGATLVGGWKMLLTTLPPVDSRGPLLALPFLIALVGAALTYAVARRWRSAYAVLVAPLGLLLLSIAMGTVTPAAVILQGVLFGLVAIGWAALRANRNRAPLQNGAGQLTRAITAGVLLLVSALGGWLIGPQLPGHGDTARSVWRTDLEPPFDITRYPSPLAGFRKFTEPNPAALFDKTILTVKGLPKGTLVRIASLDAYDGSVWGAGDAANTGTAAGGSSFRRVGAHIDASGPGRPVTATVSVAAGGYSDVWLPTAGTVTGIEFLGSRRDDLADSLRFNIDTDTAIIPERLQAGDSYRLTAIIPEPTGLTKAIVPGSGALVDTQALTFLDAKVDGWAGSTQGQWQRLLAVAKRMRSDGAYTDGGSPGNFQNVYLPGHSIGRLNRFVKSNQLAGNDEQYAATLALVANRLGLPARVVFGATPDDTGTIKGKDVHAWVEVKSDNATWVPIPAKDFMPDRKKVPNQQQLKSQEKKTGAQVPPPAAHNPPSILQGPDQAQNATQLKLPAKRSIFDPASWPGWVLFALQYVVLPLLVVIAAYCLLRAVKSRRRKRRRTTGPMSSRICGGWSELVDTARDLGVTAPPGSTRLEQARALESCREGLLLLATRADAHVFGWAEPTQPEIDAYWAQVAQARKAMRRRAGFWRRLRADVNLKSFARRPGQGSRLTAFRASRGRRMPLRRATNP